MRTLVFPSLMVIDGIGYLPITRTRAMLFFQLLARRYGAPPPSSPATQSFEDWGRDLRRRGLAAALIDRLVHHCHRQHPRKQPYRLRQARRTRPAAASRRLHPLPHPERRGRRPDPHG
ncbi:MAG: ATP-binding protein [Gemmatimonadetes bacterium]|nr:ATP-binding protein [Gemmatimonadota bacterium]